jgi:hypothetical protein
LRERIAAIERGVDPLQLSPLPVVYDTVRSIRQVTLRKVQGFTIGGLLTLAIGIGLGLTLFLLPSSDGKDAWPIGFVPALLGVALLLSARILRSSLDEA